MDGNGYDISEDEFYDRLIGRKLQIIDAIKTNPHMYSVFSDSFKTKSQTNSGISYTDSDKSWIISTVLIASRRQDGRISFRRIVKDNDGKDFTVKLVTRAYYPRDIADQKYICAVGCHKGISCWIIPIFKTDSEISHNESDRDKEFK